MDLSLFYRYCFIGITDTGHKMQVLGDPEVTANIYCKLRNLPNTDTEMTVQICGNFLVTQYVALLALLVILVLLLKIWLFGENFTTY